MNPTRFSLLAIPLALAACGGSSSDTSFQDAAPSAAALSIDLDSGAGSTVPSLAAPSSVVPLPGCHPFLFARTEAVAARLNRHFRLALDRIEHVIARHASLASGDQLVWTETFDGLDVQFTMTRAGEVFTWTLELKPAGAPDTAFATVFSGDIDRTGATGPHQGTGGFALDLDAFHSVVPAEDVAGTLHATFTLTASKRLVAITAGGVKWDPDTDGDLARVAPVDATYTYLREPGVGGSLVLQDAMVFACPSNPTLAPADATLVSRWYRTSTGEIHGRSDAKATGGQLPGGDAFMGVTCHARTADPASVPAEFYWMVKEEDATGATLQSWEVQPGAAACDPAFGAVPSPSGNGTDFDFTGVTVPYPFPGMI